MTLSKLKKFDPALITRKFFPEYIDDPKVINYGQCFVWAYVCHRLFKRVELWDMHCHAFVRHQGMFYDAEFLDGVNDWRSLVATQACGCQECQQAFRFNGAGRISLPVFMGDWGWSSYKHRVNWKRIDHDIRNLLLCGKYLGAYA